MLKNPAAKYRPFAPIALADRAWPDAVLDHAPVWLSTDLRDGNQALVEPMNMARKLRMFELLVKIGFKEIEVGFPSASQTEFDFLRRLIEEKMVPADVTIQVLTPARDTLIRRTFEALAGAERAIVHLYNATAPVMRRVVLGLDEGGIIELATRHARLIRDLALEQPQTHWAFEYSPEMFSGTELAFSKQVVDAVTEVWQPTATHKCIINLPSTVEHSTPNIFADGEFALMAGADRLEGCLFGNGERTGNIDLVNVALNLYTQGVDPELDLSDIDAIRRTVEECNQMPVHPRYPYAGDLVYTSFSGSHQDAIKKAFGARRDGDPWDMPYLPIDPKDLGRSYEAVIRVNSQSGKGGISYLLASEYGLELPRRLQIEFSQVVQAAMDVSGKEVTAPELWTLFETEYGLATTPIRQYSMQAHGHAEGVTVQAEVDMRGQTVSMQGSGTGPIDAFVAGLQEATGRAIRVVDYHQHAVGEGAAAQAVAYLELQIDGTQTLFGVGIDRSTVAASLTAIMSALARTDAAER
jgi:2-isopropylmalate synthase